MVLYYLLLYSIGLTSDFIVLTMKFLFNWSQNYNNGVETVYYIKVNGGNEMYKRLTENIVIHLLIKTAFRHQIIHLINFNMCNIILLKITLPINKS